MTADTPGHRVPWYRRAGYDEEEKREREYDERVQQLRASRYSDEDVQALEDAQRFLYLIGSNNERGRRLTKAVLELRNR